LGAIGPLVSSAQRATYLSMQSLFARLAFSAVLYLLSLLLDDRSALSWSALSELLQLCAGVGILLIVVLSVTASCTKKIETKL